MSVFPRGGGSSGGESRGAARAASSAHSRALRGSVDYFLHARFELAGCDSPVRAASLAPRSLRRRGGPPHGTTPDAGQTERFPGFCLGGPPFLPPSESVRRAPRPVPPLLPV